MRTIYFFAAAAVVVGDCGVNYCCLIANFFYFFSFVFLMQDTCTFTVQ